MGSDGTRFTEDIATLKQMEKRSENMASLIEVFQDIDETHVNQAEGEKLAQSLAWPSAVAVPNCGYICNMYHGKTM